MEYIDSDAPIDFDPINHNFEECDSILVKRKTEYNTPIYGTIGTPKWDVYPITSETKKIGTVYKNQYAIYSTDISIPQNVISVSTKSTQRIADYTDGIYVSPVLTVRYTGGSPTSNVPVRPLTVNVSWRSELETSNLKHVNVFPTVFNYAYSNLGPAQSLNILLVSHVSYPASMIQGTLHIEFLGEVIYDE